MRVALTVILAVLFLAAVLLEKTLRGVPAKELRRRARELRDKKSGNLYRLAAFGGSATLFLWLLGIFSAAGLAWLAFNSVWWSGFLAVLVIVWLTWAIRARNTKGGILFSLAAMLAPLLTPFVAFLQPLLGRLAKSIGRPLHSRLYEKDDLLDFLKQQGRQADNRISDEDLKTAASTLAFSDKTVGLIMTPKRKIKWVAASDTIAPMVMDELHKAGFSRFPVVKEVTKAENPEVVGSLYLKDLLDHLEDKGKIRDIMKPGVGYINESQSLRDAVDGFLKSGQFLLIAVNNFEEAVGMITMEEVLEQIFGHRIATEFENYNDMRSVAGQDTAQSDSQPAEPAVE